MKAKKSKLYKPSFEKSKMVFLIPIAKYIGIIGENKSKYHKKPIIRITVIIRPQKISNEFVD
jgi:hypothetical protein